MRVLYISIAVAAVATPAVAARPQQQPDDVAAAQRALRDPANARTVARVGGALTRTIMNLPVGELEAAIEGREPTAADRRRTVQDNFGGPAATARVERQLAASGAQMQAMGNALANALPGILATAGQLERDIERATANLPDPTYPRR